MRSGQLRADLGEAGDRGVGRGVGVDVRREALAEQRQRRGGPRGASVGSAAVWQAASIQGRAAGRPARASAAAAARSSSVKPMSIVPAHGSGPGQAREVGQAVEQQHDLHHGPVLAPAVRRRHARRAPRCAAGRRSTARRAARTSRPSSSTTPRARALLDEDTLDRRLQRAPARPPPRPPRAAPRSPRPCRRARSPTRPAGPAASPEVVVEGDEGGARVRPARRASRSGPGSRTARAPPPTGCRPGRRRSSRRASPARSRRASARGRAARA